MAASADIIDTAELKRLLIRSKREPINCAVGMRKNEPVIQLHPVKQGRAILKELEKQHSDLKMQRWGTAFVDTDADPKLVILTLNKDAPGLARQLKPTLKSIGFNKIEIRREDGSVAESESDEPAHLKARAEASETAEDISHTATPETVEQGEDDITAGPSAQDAISEYERNEAEARRRDAAAEAALVAEEAGASGATQRQEPEQQETEHQQQERQEQEPEIGVREQTRRLAGLIKRMANPLGADPDEIAALKALAAKVGSALKEGREDAVALIDKIEKRLKDAASKALQNDPVPPIDPSELSQTLAELVKRIMPVMAADGEIGRQLKEMAVEAKDAIRDHDPVAAALVDQLDASIRGAEKIAGAAQAVADKAAALRQEAEEEAGQAAAEAVETVTETVQGVGETLGKEAEAATERVREDVEAVRKQVEPQIDSVVETVAQTAQGIGETAGKDAAAAAQWARQAEQAAAQKAQEEYDAATKQAQEAANTAQQAAQPYIDEGAKTVEKAEETVKNTASGIFNSISDAISEGAAIE